MYVYVCTDVCAALRRRHCQTECMCVSAPMSVQHYEGDVVKLCVRVCLHRCLCSTTEATLSNCVYVYVCTDVCAALRRQHCQTECVCVSAPMSVQHYEGDVADLDLTFSYDEDTMGKIMTHELVPGGRAVTVTNDNKYVASPCVYVILVPTALEPTLHFALGHGSLYVVAND